LNQKFPASLLGVGKVVEAEALQVDIEVAGDVGLDLVEELAELAGAVAGRAPTEAPTALPRLVPATPNEDWACLHIP
jgi:hypothetical protein